MSKSKTIYDSIEKDLNYGDVLNPYELQYIASTKLKAEQIAVSLFSKKEESCELGRLYHVLKATCTNPYLEFLATSWTVTANQILVCYGGEVLFYAENDIKRSKFLNNLSLDEFLNQPHLVDEESKISIKYLGVC